MKGRLGALALLLYGATAAAAAEGPKLSLGYAYLRSLESGGGDAPLGAYLSGWGAGRNTLELDLAWHRDRESGVTLNTFTILGGPRFDFGGVSDSFCAHLLGGARIDKKSGGSKTIWGGAAGPGIDLGTGNRGGVQIRLGADFEMFFDQGKSRKALRLTAGFTF